MSPFDEVFNAVVPWIDLGTGMLNLLANLLLFLTLAILSIVGPPLVFIETAKCAKALGFRVRT